VRACVCVCVCVGGWGEGIRDMQSGKRGMCPLQVVTIYDEGGAPCLDVEGQHQC